VDLLPGGMATFTVSATIDQFASGTMSNTASVLPPAGSDPTTGDLSASVDVPLAPVAGLGISKVRLTGPVIPGMQVQYEIIAFNAGPSGARGVVIADVMPSALTNVTWTCARGDAGFTDSSCLAAASGGSGDFNATVDLASAQSLVFTVTADVLQTATGILENTATIAGPSTVRDPKASNNTSTDTTSLVPMAGLEISKTVKVPDAGVNAVAGEAIEYEIVVKNLGPSYAPNTLITDSVPASILNATWTSVCGTAAPLTTVANCLGSTGLGSIASSVNLMKDQTITFTVDGKIDASFVPDPTDPTIINEAEALLDSSVTDLVKGPQIASATVAVDRKAGLVVTKTNGVSALVPGTPTEYTIVVTNAGPSTLFDVPVSDPGHLSLLNATWSCAASAGSSCAVGGGSGPIGTTNPATNPVTVTLLPSGTATFVYSATVDPNAMPGTLTNTFTATMPSGVFDTDTSPGSGQATDTDNITPVSNLSITKADGSRCRYRAIQRCTSSK
jgi:uncharacterized repeat protein (TIGR01451 family)